jgi:hypothetical protein
VGPKTGRGASRLKTCTGWLCIASAHIMSAQRTSQKPLAAQNPSQGGGIRTWHRIPQRHGIPTAHRAHQRQRPSVCSSMYRRRTSRTRSKRERPSTSAPPALPHMRGGKTVGRSRLRASRRRVRAAGGGSQSRRRCGARVTTASKTRSSKAITTSKCCTRAAHLHHARHVAS